MTKQQERLLRKHSQRFGKILDEAQRCLKEKIPYAGEMWKILPEGTLPTAMVSYQDATDESTFLDNVAAVVKGRSDRILPPGCYTRLITKRENRQPGEMEWSIMMSDAPYEIRSSMEFIKRARGTVLVAGLGLGVTLLPVIEKRNVKVVYVLEKNEDVIKLVQPHLQKLAGAKLIVEHADAFQWLFGKDEKLQFDTIWLDIWPDISIYNLPEMKALKKVYQRYLRKGGWLGVWEWDYLHKEKRKTDREFASMFAPVGGLLHKARLKNHIHIDGKKARI